MSDPRLPSRVPDLVVLGNLLVDDIVLPDGRTRMGEPGGATLYVSLGAVLWGAQVGLVSFRSEDYPAWTLAALEARGIDLAGIQEKAGGGLRSWLLYEGSRRRVVHRLEGMSHAEVSPGFESIPEAWRRARAVHLAPMTFAVQAAAVEALAGAEGVHLSLDPFQLLTPETRPAWMAVLQRCDTFFLSEDDVVLPGFLEDPVGGLRSLAGGRLRRAIFKRGPRGGLLFDTVEDRIYDWHGQAARVIDPTGAGDAFAGGYLAALLRGEPTQSAIERGVVSASYAIEGWGPAGLLQASPEQADARWREWFGRR